MDSPHNSQGEETLWSSRLEVLIAISRVTEAIEALPSLPDNLTVRRWNHGIGQELVSRIQLFNNKEGRLTTRAKYSG